MHLDRLVSFNYADFVVGYNQMFKDVGNKIYWNSIGNYHGFKKLTFDHHLLIDL